MGNKRERILYWIYSGHLKIFVNFIAIIGQFFYETTKFKQRLLLFSPTAR